MKQIQFINVWLPIFVILCLSFGLCVGDNDWFGSNQQFLCRCTNNNCLPDGTCADGANCLREWFGPSCQYQNLITVYTATAQPNNSLYYVDDSQCNVNTNSEYIQVTWNTSYPFTFIWIRFNSSLNKETVNIQMEINGLKVDSAQVLVISNTTAEIRSSNVYRISRIMITGGLQNICSLYVSGGRNIALKQRALQDSYYQNDTNSNFAIDGYRNTDWYTGTCIHSIVQNQYHYWTVQFDKEYLINRYVLYSRWDNPNRPVCCLDRLQHFTLTSRDGSDQIVLTYTESGAVPQLIYTVTSTQLTVANVTVGLTHEVLSFCEFEAYGDSLCPPGKFGLECNKDCRCRNDEPCFTDTGTCSSGCAAGYTGMGCLTPCDEYHYGSQCKLNCSNNCMDSKCNNTNGFCLQCDDNSQGFFCEIEQLKDDRKYEGIAVGIGIGVAIGVVLTSLLVLLAALILYRFKKVSRRRKLDDMQRTKESEPGRIYRTEQNNAYDEVTDITPSGAQNNARVTGNINSYDVIDLDDVGKQTSHYLDLK